MQQVTKEMRSKHYELHGYMATDIEILNWIKSYQKQDKKKESK